MSTPGPLGLEQLSRDLDDVSVALRRLDDGSHGTCEDCGSVLDAAVLETHPAARYCLAHGGPAAS